MADHSPRISELVRVYQDLEKTLKHLKKTALNRKSVEDGINQINLKKLIAQLSRSKRRLERKIGNAFMAEQAILRRRIKAMTGLQDRSRTDS